MAVPPEVGIGKAHQAADDQLNRMGYEAELPRRLSLLSIFGLSFAIIAAPFGLSTTMALPLVNGGPVTIVYGWLLVTFISLSIAASLAEICACYPTAGGLYYWSYILSKPKYASITSWVTGWLLLVGNWMSTCAITFGGAQLILSGVSLFDAGFVPTPWQTVLTFWGVLLLCLLVNLFGVKYLDLVNKLCVYWTVISCVVIMITLLVMSKEKRSAEFVFTNFDTSRSGMPSGWSFGIGLLQATYTLTGYGMIAAMCEEVQNPQKEVPKAIVLSVVAAGITGIAFLIPILFVLPDIDYLLNETKGMPIGFLFARATGSPAAGLGLLIGVIGTMLFAGIAALTASSRCTYAFARDGAIPGSLHWRKIHHGLQVPAYALGLSSLVIASMGCIYFGSAAAFNAFTGATCICLSASFVSPVLISLLRGRRLVQHSTFSLGKVGYLLNLVSVCWVVVAFVLFSFPAQLPVTASSMNYTSVVFVGFAVISVVYYILRGRKSFEGPPVTDIMQIIEGDELGSAAAVASGTKVAKDIEG
ncbi:unnamed protein product [Clonostachys rosea]|uniref:Amino acid permease/ SLC12A domain-containing protein n=1 Tax=Bionectria ochroleuca TaxID=29856 RepID=A0ABY6TQN8_BIOOC|nr:unnamed protein product [Clonostachys rosea]